MIIETREGTMAIVKDDDVLKFSTHEHPEPMELCEIEGEQGLALLEALVENCTILEMIKRSCSTTTIM